MTRLESYGPKLIFIGTAQRGAGTTPLPSDPAR
jgi:hypothetical protein